MSGTSISDFKLETRISELNQVAALHRRFGGVAFKAMRRYYLAAGYQAGVDRLLHLIATYDEYEKGFEKEPIRYISDFLFGFFKDRGGNLPEVWTEDDTVFLKTEDTAYCVTIAAEKDAERVYSGLERTLTASGVSATLTYPIATYPTFYRGRNWYTILLKLEPTNWQADLQQIIELLPSTWRIDP